MREHMPEWNCPGGKWTAVGGGKRDEVIELLREGVRDCEVALLVGLSRERVRQVKVRWLGVRANGKSEGLK